MFDSMKVFFLFAATACLVAMAAGGAAQTATTSSASRKAAQDMLLATGIQATSVSKAQTPVATEPTRPLEGVAVLAGQRVKWFGDKRDATVSEQIPAVERTLGMKVRNLTKLDEPLTATVTRMPEITRENPNLVILFSDAAAPGAPEDTVRKSLNQFARDLQGNGIKVYFVPSSPSIEALASAQLRIAASDVGATYIEPGIEASSEPFREALSEIRRAYQTSTHAPAVVSQIGATNATAAPVTSGTRVMSAGPAQTPVVLQIRPPAPLKQFDPKPPPKQQPKKSGEQKAPAYSP